MRQELNITGMNFIVYLKTINVNISALLVSFEL
jgi:hypothetical protein